MIAAERGAPEYNARARGPDAGLLEDFEFKRLTAMRLLLKLWSSRQVKPKISYYEPYASGWYCPSGAIWPVYARWPLIRQPARLPSEARTSEGSV